MSLRGFLPLLVFNTLDLIKSWLTLGRSGPIRNFDGPVRSQSRMLSQSQWEHSSGGSAREFVYEGGRKKARTSRG